MLNKCIGIISYLPSKWSIRINRLTKIRSLLDKLNNLFNLPIIIIAQNYKDEDIVKISNDNITFIKFDKPLGIALARETLRKHFLSTNYDVIILVDDDCEIIGDNASEYLKQIDDHPNMLGAMHDSLHKLMSVSRNVYEKYGYDLVNTPDKHIAFEDALFYWPIIAKDRNLKFNFVNTGLKDISRSRGDKDSCWSSSLDNETKRRINLTTDKIIEERTGMNILDIYKLEGYQKYNVTEIDD